MHEKTWNLADGPLHRGAGTGPPPNETMRPPPPTPEDKSRARAHDKRLTAREGRLAPTGRRGPVRVDGETASVRREDSGRSFDGRQCDRENKPLINNRQGGRRRGRGGQRPQGMPGNSGGNRQDNRQRGNAAQLLEKYKSLARDSQLAGDRVQTEYYLQFADHYFRVLEESRSRFEEQQSHRRRRDDDEDELEGDEEMTADADSSDEDSDGETEVRQQRPRRERYERGDRAERPASRQANGSRRDREEEQGDERIALGVLPPAIGPADGAVEEEEAPKPRRRARKPRAESGDDEIAPAA